MEIPPKLHGSRVVDKDASGPACRRRQATRTNLLASEEAANENQERNPEPSHYFSSSQFQLPNSRIENFPTGGLVWESEERNEGELRVLGWRNFYYKSKFPKIPFNPLPST